MCKKKMEIWTDKELRIILSKKFSELQKYTEN